MTAPSLEPVAGTSSEVLVPPSTYAATSTVAVRVATGWITGREATVGLLELRHGQWRFVTLPSGGGMAGFADGLHPDDHTLGILHYLPRASGAGAVFGVLHEAATGDSSETVNPLPQLRQKYAAILAELPQETSGPKAGQLRREFRFLDRKRRRAGRRLLGRG